MSSLEQQDAEKIKNLYNDFKENLRKDIENKNELISKECYIIRKNWDDELSNNIRNIRPAYRASSIHRRFHSNISNKFNLPNCSIEFINDIDTIRKCLTKNEQLCLESCELIEFIDNKTRLNYSKRKMKYWAGNKNIIIELEGKTEVLLIEDASSIINGISRCNKFSKTRGMFHSNPKEQEMKKLLKFPNIIEEDNTPSIKEGFSRSVSQGIYGKYRNHKFKNEKNENEKEDINNNKEIIEQKQYARYIPKYRKMNKNDEIKNEDKNNDNSTKYNNYLQIPENKDNNRFGFGYRRNFKSSEITNNPQINRFNFGNNYDKEIDSTKNEIEKRKNDYEKEIKNIKDKKNEEIDILNTKIKNNEKEIKEYKNKETNYLAQIKKLESDLKRKEREIETKISNLEREKNNLSTKNKELEKEKYDIDKKLKEEIKEGDKLYEENQTLKKNEKNFNKTISELEKRIKNNERDYNNKINKIEKDYKNKIVTLERDLNYKKYDYEELTKENLILKQNEEKYKNQIKIFGDNEINYSSKIKELEIREKEFKNKINNYEKEKRDLIEKNKELEKNYSEIDKELNDEISYNKELEEKMKKNEKENNKIIKELKNTIENKDKEFNNQKIILEKDKKENKKIISDIQKDLNNLQKYNKEIEKENQKLKSNEKSFLKRIKDYENNEKSYQWEIKEAQNKINKLENDLQDMKNNSNEINNGINKLYDENDLLKNKEKEYLDKIKSLEMKLKEKVDKSDKLNQKKIKEINEKMLFIENKEIELENEHKKIESTKKELEIIRKELDEEKKKISNNQIQLNNQNKFNNMNFNKNNFNGMNNQNRGFNGLNIIPNFGMMPQNGIFNVNGVNNNNNFGDEPYHKPNNDRDFPYKLTLIGLNNIGATCYLNSTLQCLSQTKALTKYFLNKKNRDKIINNNIAKKNKNELQLCPVYLELIENLWKENSPNKSFSPNNFMNTIEAMNPLFKKGQAGDSKDFIIFILEQIHTELKHSALNNIEPKNPLNQYDKKNAFDHFFYDFKNELSIISDIFFGFNETTNVCLNCKNNYNSRNLANPICYNYGIFNVIIFPLEEVKNMKNRNNFMMSNNNIVDINDCFYYNQKTDYFTGENKNYCNICRQLFDSEYTSKIYSSPNVLILILNRGKNNIYNVKINFKEEINISQFVQMKNSTQVYELYGVITHLGESGPNAHFVASCKSPIDNNWYRYNDAMVNPIFNFMKEIHEFGKPYILFYQKKVNK